MSTPASSRGPAWPASSRSAVAKRRRRPDAARQRCRRRSVPPVDGPAVFSHLHAEPARGPLRRRPAASAGSGEAWIGTDYDRLWLKRRHARQRQRSKTASTSSSTPAPITPISICQAGCRNDLDSAPGRDWAAFGIEGLAPLFFHVAATGYVSGDGHLAAKLEGTYDLLITQRLILQPQIEMNFYTQGRSGARRRQRAFRHRYRPAPALRDHPQIRALYRRDLRGQVRRHRRLCPRCRPRDRRGPLHAWSADMVLNLSSQKPDAEF